MLTVLHTEQILFPTSLISPQGYDVLGNPRTFNSRRKLPLTTFVVLWTECSIIPIATVPEELPIAIQTELHFKTLLLICIPKRKTPLFWIHGTQEERWTMTCTIFFSRKRSFAPSLLNFSWWICRDVDVCHFQFSQYANNLRKADFAVAQLWKTIQSTREWPMIPYSSSRRNTEEILSEHFSGCIRSARTRSHCSYRSKFYRWSNLNMAREIFCLVVGPPNVVVQNQTISTIMGEKHRNSSRHR